MTLVGGGLMDERMGRLGSGAWVWMDWGGWMGRGGGADGWVDGSRDASSCTNFRINLGSVCVWGSYGYMGTTWDQSVTYLETIWIFGTRLESILVRSETHPKSMGGEGVLQMCNVRHDLGVPLKAPFFQIPNISG